MPDVTIYGAGIFGLSIGWSCLKKGAQVRVVDPNGPGGGASGGLVGALAPHVPENWNEKKAFQFESLLMAEPFWAEVEAASQQNSGYARTGRLQPIADDHSLGLAQGREVSAEALWGTQAQWRIVSQSDVDIAPVSPTGLFIYDTLSARLHPRQACVALAKAIEAVGGQIVMHAEPKGRVVHATGANGLYALSKELGAPIGDGVKGQAALLDYSRPGSPQLFADSLHVIFHADGTTAVGSTSERDYTVADETDTQLEDILQRVRRAVPALLNARVIDRWAGLRPRAKTRAPLLGYHPLRQDQFIANGGFKIGFGMAPKIAQVMADLILDGKDAIPDAFRVECALPQDASRLL